MNRVGVGGFLEVSLSDGYLFKNSKVNDILLYSDYSNQNIHFGTGPDSNILSSLSIQNEMVEVGKSICIRSNIYIGKGDPSYQESFVLSQGNAMFTSNLYIVNKLTVGASNAGDGFTLIGKSNDFFLGPHLLCYFNDKNDPVYQLIPKTHDDIVQAYDMAWSNNEWISASSNANFLIQKSKDQLATFTSYGNAQGTICSPEVAFVINKNKNVAFGSSNSNYRITITGPSNNILNGPNIAHFVDSDMFNPALQTVVANHDDIHIGFNAHMNSNSEWISSSCNSSFILSKQNNILSLRSGFSSNIGSPMDALLNQALCVNSNGNIGLGSKDTSHKLTLFGPPNDYTVGPHLMFLTNNDRYPLFQHLNLDHDSIFQGYDMYYDKNFAAYMSSSFNGNFLLQKGMGHLTFYSASNIRPGKNISNIEDNFLQTVLSFNSNSFIGIGTVTPNNRITINGPSNHDYGPHMSFTVESDISFPVYQQRIMNHDHIIQAYGAYMSNNEWWSSSSNSSFFINKSTKNLIFSSVKSTGKGSNCTNITKPAITIDNVANVGIGVSETDPSFKFEVNGYTKLKNGTVIEDGVFSFSNNSTKIELVGNQNTLGVLGHAQIDKNLSVLGNAFISGGIEVGEDSLQSVMSEIRNPYTFRFGIPKSTVLTDRYVIPFSIVKEEFNIKTINDGGFRAPVGGIYWISCSIGILNSDVNAQMSLGVSVSPINLQQCSVDGVLGDTSMKLTTTCTGSRDPVLQVSGLVYMAYQDYAKAFISNTNLSNISTVSYNNTTTCFFCGHLIST